jgi:tRNA(adenine34) deaminase
LLFCFGLFFKIIFLEIFSIFVKIFDYYLISISYNNLKINLFAMIFQTDEWYMGKALKLASLSENLNEVPIGAVIVDQYGTIIGKGFNRVEHFKFQGHHAEIRALEQATKKIKDWRLEKCTVYVTLEPCMMCISLCALSRVARIVYGASSPLFGSHLESEIIKGHYMKSIQNITAGVLAEESALILKKFFNKRRETLK